jgi:sugar-phosphatase
VRAGRCVVFEDAPAGLAAARAAGAVAVALATTHPPQALEADAVVATLADVCAARVGGEIVLTLRELAAQPRRA